MGTFGQTPDSVDPLLEVTDIINEADYTLGKELEAVILWNLIKDNKTKQRKNIGARLHSYNAKIKEIQKSNLSEKTKKSIITGFWHEYKDNYIKTNGYDINNKIDTFFLCLLKIRFRAAVGYKYIKKEKNEN
jgi:hypothetical protein